MLCQVFVRPHVKRPEKEGRTSLSLWHLCAVSAILLDLCSIFISTLGWYFSFGILQAVLLQTMIKQHQDQIDQQKSQHLLKTANGFPSSSPSPSSRSELNLGELFLIRFLDTSWLAMSTLYASLWTCPLESLLTYASFSEAGRLYKQLQSFQPSVASLVFNEGYSWHGLGEKLHGSYGLRGSAILTVIGITIHGLDWYTHEWSNRHACIRRI